MKKIRPDLKWVQTQLGWNLQIRVVLSAGYKLEMPEAPAQLSDLDHLSLDLVPDSKSKGGIQEVSIPFPKRPKTELSIEVKDVSGKSVGGGKVVFLDDADEK